MKDEARISRIRYDALMRIATFVAILLLFRLPAWAQPAAPDPRVKPGAKFFLEFPNLPKTRTGDVSKMQVILPKSYDLKKQYPMIAWLSGGDGGPGFGGGAIIDPNTFVCVGLPFMKGATSRVQGNMVGDFAHLWPYHRYMLDELHRIVPNITPYLRVIAGFSNGAHTTVGYMGSRELDFPAYFNVFIPGEGAYQGGSYAHLAGRHIFIAWGELKGSNKSGAQGIVAEATRAGLRVQTCPEPNSGHAFDAEGMGKAAAWLKETVTADLLAQATAAMEKSSSGPAMPRAFAIAKGVEVLAPGTPSEAKFGGLFDKIEGRIKSEFATLRTRAETAKTAGEKKSAAEPLKTFLRNYRLSATGEEGRQFVSDLGQPEIDKLIASFPKGPNSGQRLAAAGQLRQFAKDWEFTVPGDSAAALLETFAQQNLAEIKAGLPEPSTPTQRDAVITQIKKYLADWPNTRGASDGLLFLADVGRLVLAEMKAEWPEKMTPAQRDAAALKVLRFREAWKATLAAADATDVLGDLGEQEVEAFKATWPSAPTAAQKKLILDHLKLLQKKWEGTSAADLCAALMKEAAP